jgi:hypothetical protein
MVVCRGRNNIIVFGPNANLNGTALTTTTAGALPFHVVYIFVNNDDEYFASLLPRLIKASFGYLFSPRSTWTSSHEAEEAIRDEATKGQNESNA